MNELQDHLPGVPDALELMSPSEIVGYIIQLVEKVTEIEKSMDRASRALESVYGLTVDQVLTADSTTLVSIRGEKQNAKRE